jgi:hypothetical protein
MDYEGALDTPGPLNGTSEVSKVSKPSTAEVELEIHPKIDTLLSS